MTRFDRDDRGVNEVLGFILTFALSAIFLMMALTSFYTARNNSEDVITGVEMKSVADRVATAIVDAGIVGQEFPNATLDLVVEVPTDLNGRPYAIEATSTNVYGNTTDGMVSARATTFRLDAVTNVQVSGLVQSLHGRVIVTYSLLPGNVRDIQIHGE